MQKQYDGHGGCQTNASVVFTKPSSNSTRAHEGVFSTCNTGPFLPSDTDIHPKTNVARHQHSDLGPRHLTLQFNPTLTVSFLSRRQTLCKISGRRPTLRPPFMGPSTGTGTIHKC